MLSALSSSSLISAAIAFDAAIFISSLISLARTSNAPRNTPGNTSTLLIWFGKSERPVATTFAPPFFASSGIISGVGFAIANTIASSAIVLTISEVTIFGADTPTKISLPFIAVFRSPCRRSLFVISAISFCARFIHSSPGARIPLRSTRTTSPIPSSRSRRQIEIPAEPAPLITTFASENSLCT